MSGDIELCTVSDIPEDEGLQVLLPNGHALALFSHEGEIVCMDDLCTHGDASLADGEIEDGCVICPFHMGAFCIKTGEATAAPCTEPIKIYPTTVRDGYVFIRWNQ